MTAIDTETRPHGIQGFETPEAAKLDAAARGFDDAAILERDAEYAWVWPKDYAERICKSNGARIVQ